MIIHLIFFLSSCKPTTEFKRMIGLFSICKHLKVSSPNKLQQTNSTFTGHNEKKTLMLDFHRATNQMEGLTHSAAEKKAKLRIVVQNIEDDLYCSQLNTSHCFKNFLFCHFVPDSPASARVLVSSVCADCTFCLGLL